MPGQFREFTVRRGRIQGFRPTAEQIQDVWQLAQKGFDSTATDTKISYDPGNSKSIEDDDLANFVREVKKDRDLLTNLHLKSSQANPRRIVEISIGPDSWTTYEVQAEDSTWALGRFEELTAALLEARPFLAAIRAKAPEWQPYSYLQQEKNRPRTGKRLSVRWREGPSWQPRTWLPFQSAAKHRLEFTLTLLITYARMVLFALPLVLAILGSEILIFNIWGIAYLTERKQPIWNPETLARYAWLGVACGILNWAIGRWLHLQLQARVFLTKRKIEVNLPLIVGIISAIAAIVQIFVSL
ncbi:hypothetical protein [Nonomuraea sp. SYSU D8015]|uniref:hypothetical protein n=1 Tax=Nonomuraea sp. SYSU D8015 TaxID=2593644 RepID=UPI001661188F|nr:hypothetical protein [Nonomuraea sp. SYSU D8015]